jgi:hypothetical protein
MVSEEFTKQSLLKTARVVRASDTSIRLDTFKNKMELSKNWLIMSLLTLKMIMK